MVVGRIGEGYKRRDGVLALTYIISASLQWETLVKILLVPPFDENLFDPSFFLYFLPNLPVLHFPSQLPHDGSPPFLKPSCLDKYI